MDFDFKRLQKFVEAINTYYAFALLMYVVVLYVAGHSQLFLWVLLGVTPLLALWSGYLLRSYFDSRNQKHGFRLLSNEMTYEIMGHGAYRTRAHTTVRAEANRMMVYPMGYKWTGEGKAGVPHLEDPGQRLIGVIRKYDAGQDTAKIGPYKELVSTEGDWSYWFVGLSRALYKGEVADIVYTQNFYDSKKKAKSYVNYMVNTSIQNLVLNVKFPADALPTKVTCCYFKLNDRRRTYAASGVVYDSQKQWATWTIEKPKFGYSYRIDWQ